MRPASHQLGFVEHDRLPHWKLVPCLAPMTTAPTGYEKSTLATGFVSRASVTSCRVSLDTGDNAPTTFSSRLPDVLGAGWMPHTADHSGYRSPATSNGRSTASSAIDRLPRLRQTCPQLPRPDDHRHDSGADMSSQTHLEFCELDCYDARNVPLSGHTSGPVVVASPSLSWRLPWTLPASIGAPNSLLSVDSPAVRP